MCVWCSFAYVVQNNDMYRDWGMARNGGQWGSPWGAAGIMKWQQANQYWSRNCRGCSGHSRQHVRPQKTYQYGQPTPAVFQLE